MGSGLMSQPQKCYFPPVWGYLCTIMSVKQETVGFILTVGHDDAADLRVETTKKSRASGWKIKWQLFPWDTFYLVENCWF